MTDKFYFNIYPLKGGFILANKVKERRKELGKTQKWLAEKAGVSRQTIYDIENERFNPGIDIATKISRALGRLCEELFPTEM